MLLIPIAKHAVLPDCYTDWVAISGTVWRKVAKATMLYKILHDMVAIPFRQYRVPISSNTRGHLQRFCQITAHINAYLLSYFPSTLKIWTSLPEAVVEADSVEEFKKLIRKYYECIN